MQRAVCCNFDTGGGSDSDGTIVDYSWSFGGKGVTASHTFSGSGTYAATVTVTDKDGRTASAS